MSSTGNPDPDPHPNPSPSSGSSPGPEPNQVRARLVSSTGKEITQEEGMMLQMTLHQVKG